MLIYQLERLNRNLEEFIKVQNHDSLIAQIESLAGSVSRAVDTMKGVVPDAALAASVAKLADAQKALDDALAAFASKPSV